MKLASSNDEEHSKRELFSSSIRGLLGDSVSLPVEPPQNIVEDYWEMEPYGDNVEDMIAFVGKRVPVRQRSSDSVGKPS